MSAASGCRIWPGWGEDGALEAVTEFPKTIEDLTRRVETALTDADEQGVADGSVTCSGVAGVTLSAVGDRQLGLQCSVLLAQPLVLGARGLQALAQRRLARALP